MIKHVQIKNYKSLSDVSVHLDPVTILVGRSGTGKTNFVEALCFLRDCLISKNVQGLLQQTGSGNWDSILSCTPSEPRHLTFNVSFSVSRTSEDFRYILSFQGHQVWEESLFLGEKKLFHQNQGKWIQLPNVPSPPQAGGLALGTVNGLHEDTIASLYLTRNIGCYAFPDHVLARSDPPSGPQVTGFADNGGNFLQVISAIHDNLSALPPLQNMVASMQSLKPSLKAIDIIKPGNQQVLVRHVVDSLAFSFELRQESEGFRRLLACLIALYQEPPKQTVIFDEPEKGIYPAGLEILAEEFKGFASKERGQVILTTHSPEFLNQFAPQQIRVVEMQNYQTRIGPVAPEQMEALREHYLETKELLTVDEARLQGALAEGQ